MSYKFTYPHMSRNFLLSEKGVKDEELIIILSQFGQHLTLSLLEKLRFL